MERMRLTKIEKYILLTLSKTRNDCPPSAVSSHFPGVEIEVILYSYDALSDKGLIHVIIDGYRLLAVEITTKGLAYVHEYPDLENLEDPLRLERETRMLSLVSVVTATVSILLSVLNLLL